VPARDVLQSPVLVGRDSQLGLIDRWLADADAGKGRLLFIAGEAGIGKTRLLGSAARRAQRSSFAVAQAAAFPGDVQSFAGLLLDLASSLTYAEDPALIDLGRTLASRARADLTGRGDAHHRRRLLVQDLADLILGAHVGRPMLIILEDLHWADELSLDVIGHLAGRLAARPVLVAGAYRSDELYPRLPMRELRARLLSQRLAEEVRLPRLTLDQTASMASATLGRPAPAQVIAAIQERSDGIPLHIEEFLAVMTDEALTPRANAAVQAAAVPDTLGDAVLSRAQLLSTAARNVALAAAVIGRSFDFDVLTEVTGLTPGEVADALRELEDAYFVLPGGDAGSFDFRHALIRDTLYADGGVAQRRSMHGCVARATVARGYRDAFVSAHFEQAGQAGLAYRHAVDAAAEAALVSAHGEALELYRRAVRNLPPDLPAPTRARVFSALGDEAAAADDNEAAADAYRMAHELTTAAGDVRGAAALVPRMVAVGHLLGDDLTIRVRSLQAALDSLTGLQAAERERAQLRSGMAAAYMLDRRLEGAIDLGERGLRESQRSGDQQTALNVAATLGSVLVFAGRMDEGWRTLEDAIARAAGTHREAEAARGYRMLTSCASVLVEYDRAERWMADGIGYAAKVELWNHRHYMASHLAHVQWCTGRWAAAAQLAQQALADGRGGITTQITAQYVLGYLALGRGDWDAATQLLEEAVALGQHMAELQRLSPPLWGLAEAARCQGDNDTALALCEHGYQASAAVGDAAYLFPYLLTGVRAQLARGQSSAAEAWLDRVSAILTVRGIPGTLPAIEHGRGLILLSRGEVAAAYQALASAEAAWHGRRRFWEGTWALLDLAAAAVKNRRHGEAAELADQARIAAADAGAGPIAHAAAQFVTSLRLRPPRSPWHPLSDREFEIARLIADGLTNKQIAERLVLAPKTISAHVAHILTKLGAGRRAEIAAWCAAIQIANRSSRDQPTA
jgi:DNA-binding CsgD family transcriptional regulator